MNFFFAWTKFIQTMAQLILFFFFNFFSIKLYKFFVTIEWYQLYISPDIAYHCTAAIIDHK